MVVILWVIRWAPVFTSSCWGNNFWPIGVSFNHLQPASACTTAPCRTWFFLLFSGVTKLCESQQMWLWSCIHTAIQPLWSLCMRCKGSRSESSAKTDSRGRNNGLDYTKVRAVLQVHGKMIILNDYLTVWFSCIIAINWKEIKTSEMAICVKPFDGRS